jgi:ubiquinone/menaquinone biosynthesis C-methylase UbiE
MTERTEIMLAGEYFLGVQGLAIIRSCFTNPPVSRARVDDVRRIIERFDQFPQSLEIPVKEYGVEEGYTRWSAHYDGPNPAIAVEEPIVKAMLADITPGVALDAACGTGRHAATLVALGHRVIGVDMTDAMMDRARAKVPQAEFRRGRLEALPVDDESVDLVTCALALTHVPSLEPVIREFARVLRPGGTAILSDMHPVVQLTGGVAGFGKESDGLGVPYVANLTHQVSHYVSSFIGAGLTVRACVEPEITEDLATIFPPYRVWPEATRAAWMGLPYLLIWRVTR